MHNILACSSHYLGINAGQLVRTAGFSPSLTHTNFLFQDVFQQAMDHLVESSMFVAESARKFIAKYMTALYNSTTHYNNTNSETDDGDSTMHHCSKVPANSVSISLHA